MPAERPPGRSEEPLIGQRAFWLGAVGSAGFLAVFAYFFVDFATIGDVLRDAHAEELAALALRSVRFGAAAETLVFPRSVLALRLPPAAGSSFTPACPISQSISSKTGSCLT